MRRCARCGVGAVFRDAPGQRTARGARGVCGAVFRDTGIRLVTVACVMLVAYVTCVDSVGP